MVLPHPHQHLYLHCHLHPHPHHLLLPSPSTLLASTSCPHPRPHPHSHSRSHPIHLYGPLTHPSPPIMTPALDAGGIYVAGLVKHTAFPLNTAIFTLPTTHRPAIREIFASLCTALFLFLTLTLTQPLTE